MDRTRWALGGDKNEVMNGQVDASDEIFVLIRDLLTQIKLILKAS